MLFREINSFYTVYTNEAGMIYCIVASSLPVKKEPTQCSDKFVH